MTLEERVAQMFFVGCPASRAADVLSEYALGGYILFASNLSGLTADDVRSMLDGFQENAKIPPVDRRGRGGRHGRARQLEPEPARGAVSVPA